MKRILALVVLPLACVAVTASQIVPPFKSQTDLVDVDAVVTDGRGDPVQGLDRSDFVVEEDGHPIAISTFAEVDADRATSAGDGRFIVLLFDPRFIRAKAVARMIVDRTASHDVMALLSLTGSAAKTATGRAAALEQLDQLERTARTVTSPAGRRALRSGGPQPGEPCEGCGQSAASADSPDASRVILPESRVPASLGPMTSGERSQVLTMIGDLANQLRAVHRRKTLVYIGNASALELSLTKGMTGPWFDAVRSLARGCQRVGDRPKRDDGTALRRRARVRSRNRRRGVRQSQ